MITSLNQAMTSSLECMNEQAMEIKVRLNSLLRHHHDNEETKKVSRKVAEALQKYLKHFPIILTVKNY